MKLAPLTIAAVQHQDLVQRQRDGSNAYSHDLSQKVATKEGCHSEYPSRRGNVNTTLSYKIQMRCQWPNSNKFLASLEILGWLHTTHLPLAQGGADFWAGQLPRAVGRIKQPSWAPGQLGQTASPASSLRCLPCTQPQGSSVLAGETLWLQDCLA